MENKTQIICLKSDAFTALLDEVISYIDVKYSQPKEIWIDINAAMALLNISSRSTIQALRDEGKIRYSQSSRKHILYDRNSILKYIEANAKKTF